MPNSKPARELVESTIRKLPSDRLVAMAERIAGRIDALEQAFEVVTEELDARGVELP